MVHWGCIDYEMFSCPTRIFLLWVKLHALHDRTQYSEQYIHVFYLLEDWVREVQCPISPGALQYAPLALLPRAASP